MMYVADIVKVILIFVLISLSGFLIYDFVIIYYKGPVSDHFDGKKFFNTPSIDKTFLDIIQYFYKRDPTIWPTNIQEKKFPIPDRIVQNNELSVTFVNHSTLLIQTQGLNILTDPIWSERASPFNSIGPKRYQEPGIDFRTLPPIDIVLISHSHYDHMDISTIKKLIESHNPTIIVGLGNDFILNRNGIYDKIISLDWNEIITIKDNFIITFIPNRHWSKRTIFDNNKALWGDFLIRTAGGNIYFGADSAYGDHYKNIYREYGKMRFTAISIGSYEPRWFTEDTNVNPQEAVKAIKDLHSEYAIGINFGTFKLSDEAFDQPQYDFSSALKKEEMPTSKYRTLQNGESWNIPELVQTDSFYDEYDKVQIFSPVK